MPIFPHRMSSGHLRSFSREIRYAARVLQEVIPIAPHQVAYEAAAWLIHNTLAGQIQMVMMQAAVACTAYFFSCLKGWDKAAN
eukprot:scaffold9605_cov128-Skeletonema_marinoi.AAC.6